jgi:hypothetical protein
MRIEFTWLLRPPACAEVTSCSSVVCASGWVPNANTRLVRTVPLASATLSFSRTCSIIGGPAGLRFVALSLLVHAAAPIVTIATAMRLQSVFIGLSSPDS